MPYEGRIKTQNIQVQVFSQREKTCSPTYTYKERGGILKDNLHAGILRDNFSNIELSQLLSFC